MNLLHLLDSILIDWASPRTRRTIHSTLLIVALVITVWLSSEGDWKKALLTLAAALYAASNRSNTVPGTTPAGFNDTVGMNPTCCGGNQYPLEFPVSGNH